MSKSKGNVVTPMPLVEEYGADALRYWACNGRPGVDTAVDFGVMKVGRKLAIKVLNASKFVLGVSGDAADDRCSEVMTRARPSLLLVRSASSSTTRPTAFDGVRLRAFARTDRTLLLVVLRRLRRAREESRVRRRGRRRGALGRGRAADRAVDDAAPARAGARVRERRGVVVVARRLGPPRRVADGLRGAARDRRSADPLVYTVAAEVLAEVRKVKSTQKVSLATPVDAGARRRHRRAARRARGGPRRRVRRGKDRHSSRSRSASRSRSQVELAGGDARREQPRGLRRARLAGLARQPREPERARREPPGAAHARADLHADDIPRLARDRVPGHPRHRYERQDHDGPGAHRAARARSA